MTLDYKGKVVGYLQVKVEEGSFIGGVLVVDEKGVPLDFFYTDPVKPDRLQFIIYGDSLANYLKVDVISRKLIDMPKDKPSIWFVEDDEIVQGADRLGVGIALLRATNLPALEGVGTIKQDEEDRILVQAVELLPPMDVRFKGTSVEEIAGLIVELSKTMDVLEPFSRLKEALLWIYKNHKSS